MTAMTSTTIEDVIDCTGINFQGILFNPQEIQKLEIKPGYLHCHRNMHGAIAVSAILHGNIQSARCIVIISEISLARLIF